MPGTPTVDPAAPIVEIVYPGVFYAATIGLSDLTWMEKAVIFFKRMNKKATTASLVENGLNDEKAITRKEIQDCVFIVADVMSEIWKTASKETAAGIVLVVLAKNSMLKDTINATGWNLVSNLFKTNPEFAADISSGTLAEINRYQASGFEPVGI
jgi:hypothetical protein